MDKVKHNVEKNQKKTKNRRRNNASPLVMSAKRPRTLYNLRKHEPKLIIEAPAISSLLVRSEKSK